MPSTRTRKRKRASSSSNLPPIHTQDVEAGSQQGSEKEAEMWDAFREEYVESVEQLPLSIHRNFALLNELDAQTNAMDAVLPQKIREYIRSRQEIRQSTMNGIPQPQKPVLTPRRSSARSSALRAAAQQTNGIGDGHNNHAQIKTEAVRNYKLLSEISFVMNELFRTAEEKVNLAQATYDSIDRHVRLLDQAIREHELHWKGDLSAAQINSPTFPIMNLLMTRMKDNGESLDVHSGAGAGTVIGTATEKLSRSRSGTRSRRGLKRRSTSSVLDPITSDDILNGEDENGGDGIAAKVGDMPIDPNEPRYCYCEGVSWGKMIGCDANGCEREWFHLGCVGLTEAPKRVKWYCDECIEKNLAGRRRTY